jgi:ADP-ribose pyrophosphatase
MSKLPENARKVFEGVIFDVYQWEQEMYDGSTATFERIDRADTADIIALTPQGKILIQHQRQPDREDWFLCLVGGRIETGEDPLDGAKREMLEETGHTSEQWKLIDRYQPTHKIRWEMFVYVARECTKVAQQNLDSGEQIQLKEVTFDEFIELVDSREMKRIPDVIRERCIRAKYHKPSYEAFKKEIFGGL